MLLDVLTLIYVGCAILLALYALGALVLLITFFRHRNKSPEARKLTEFPAAAVQLPIYNEVYVVERLIKAVTAIDYPRERLFVQVLDDSTDETTARIEALLPDLLAEGVQIAHIRRPNRQGYKAGALAYGLTLLPPEVEYVAVLDADFVPPADFLKRTIPFMIDDARLGMVQARWGHLNSQDNVLTRGQTLALDGHFVVEQTARNRAGWLMNFNGTGGVWRRETISDAGGWRDVTLTEDLDLSYRAQLNGWKFLYIPELVVPGELPPHIAAYKQQQARWAKGGTQCMKLLFVPIWTHRRLSLMQRLMATMHVCQYLVHPLIVVMLLVTPFLLVTGRMNGLLLWPLGIFALGPPLIFIISQRELYPDWRRRLLALPPLIALGTGTAWSNARAVVSGLLNRPEEFKRTPKYADHKQANQYAVRLNANVYFELFLSMYAFGTAALAMHYAFGLAPYLLLYGFAFGIVALWGLRDYLEMRREQRLAAA
ncbi:MAG TPA: glycosyltransferase family 2 protein [Candidatus Limnocylindrales bacterium]|nr:glycosyltransferase family 2 protein [Candidatus Limnocylindrales bacterium]